MRLLIHNNETQKNSVQAIINSEIYELRLPLLLVLVFFNDFLQQLHSFTI